MRFSRQETYFILFIFRLFLLSLLVIKIDDVTFSQSESRSVAQSDRPPLCWLFSHAVRRVFYAKIYVVFFFLQPCDGEMIILLHYHLKVGLRLFYVSLQLFEIRNRTLPKSMLIGLAPPMYFYPCLFLFIVVSVSFPSVL